MAESGPPQYHAVYLVPFWDDFVYEDDDDDDDDDHWVTEQEYQTCTDNLIMWPEPVPFHRATPAPA